MYELPEPYFGNINQSYYKIRNKSHLTNNIQRFELVTLRQKKTKKSEQSKNCYFQTAFIVGIYLAMSKPLIKQSSS